MPTEIEAASSDLRRLGVAVERLVLYDDRTLLEVRCDHSALRDGFHDAEATHRWTNGRARLPRSLLRPFAGAFTLEMHVVPNGLSYRVPTASRDVATA
jgi:hypothetical protein